MRPRAAGNFHVNAATPAKVAKAEPVAKAADKPTAKP